MGTENRSAPKALAYCVLVRWLFTKPGSIKNSALIPADKTCTCWLSSDSPHVHHVFSIESCSVARSSAEADPLPAIGKRQSVDYMNRLRQSGGHCDNATVWSGLKTLPPEVAVAHRGDRPVSTSSRVHDRGSRNGQMSLVCVYQSRRMKGVLEAPQKKLLAHDPTITFHRMALDIAELRLVPQGSKCRIFSFFLNEGIPFVLY